MIYKTKTNKFMVYFFYFFQETQKLWALDLSLHFSDSLSMYQLMQYVSNGALDTTTHEFNVPAPKSDSTKRRRRRLAGEKEEVSLIIVTISTKCPIIHFCFNSIKSP